MSTIIYNAILNHRNHGGIKKMFCELIIVLYKRNSCISVTKHICTMFITY